MTAPMRTRMRKWLVAMLLTLACLGGATSTVGAGQPAQPAARDEFVPIREIPAEDQVPAAPLVIGAYGVAWLAILLYVWSLWKRQARVEAELQALNSRLSSRGR